MDLVWIACATNFALSLTHAEYEDNEHYLKKKLFENRCFKDLLFPSYKIFEI